MGNFVRSERVVVSRALVVIEVLRLGGIFATVGQGLQIALFVLPVMTILSWCGVGQAEDAVMILVFDKLAVSALCFAVIIVNYVIRVSDTTANRWHIKIICNRMAIYIGLKVC